MTARARNMRWMINQWHLVSSSSTEEEYIDPNTLQYVDFSTSGWLEPSMNPGTAVDEITDAEDEPDMEVAASHH